MMHDTLGKKGTVTVLLLEIVPFYWRGTLFSFVLWV